MTLQGTLALSALAVVVALLALLQLGLMRRVLRVLEQIAEAQTEFLPQDRALAAGAVMLEAWATDAKDQRVNVTELSRGDPIIILLTSADCEPCHHLLNQLAESGWSEQVQLVVVIDAPSSVESSLRDQGLVILHDSQDASVERALQSNVFPRAFAVQHARVSAPSVIPGSARDLAVLAQNASASRVPLSATPNK